MLTPLRYARPNQCRFCTSRRCSLRIVSECGTIDEVACWRHGEDLCRYANEVAPGISKLHSVGTSRYRRNSPPPAEAFEQHRTRVAEIGATKA